MSYAVVAAEPGGGSQTSDASNACDCEDDAFLHHLKRPGVHLFTANRCGHCRRMKAGFEGQDLTKPVPYIEHEESTYDSKSLENTNFDVTGYPTIYFVKANGDGEIATKKYEGPRDKQSIDDAYSVFLRRL